MTASGLPLRADIGAVAAKRGLLPASGQANVLTTPWEYYHRVNVPVAGVTNYTFFNETKALGVTNLDNQGVLPANQVFEVQGIKFNFLPGFDRTGLRLGAATSQAIIEASLLNRSATVASSADPAAALVLWQEKSRELLEQGAMRFVVNGRVLHDSYGLSKFPSGRGVLSESAQAISGTFAAGAGLSSVRSNVLNGAPFAQNVQRFQSKLAIFPSQSFNVTVDYNRNVDFTQQFGGPLNGVTGAITAGVLECSLFGVLITTLS